MIGGFFLFATAASVLSVALLHGDDTKKDTHDHSSEISTQLDGDPLTADGTGDVASEIVTEPTEPFVSDSPDYTPVTEEGGAEIEILPEQEAEHLLRLAMPFILNGDWVKAEEMLRPALLDYDATQGEKAQQLANVYSDVTTLQAVMAKGDTERMAILLNDFNDPTMFILAPLFFPQEAWYAIADDTASLMLSQRGAVTYNGVKEIPAYSDANFTPNPELDADPFIRAYRARQTYAEPQETFYIHDLTVRGIKIHGYSLRIAGNDNRLIGYYYQPNSEHGTFLTISNYLEHRRDMTDALEDNWGND